MHKLIIMGDIWNHFMVAFRHIFLIVIFHEKNMKNHLQNSMFLVWIILII